MHAMLPVLLAESNVLVCSQATEATAGDFLCAQEVKLQLDVDVPSSRLPNVYQLSVTNLIAVVLLCI